jgi:tetratricopeptide (TPR) repeat protein
MTRRHLAVGILRVAVAIMGVLAVGCGDDRIEEVPPLPTLEGMEPAVVAKVKEAHAEAIADPTPAKWGRYARILHAHEMWPDALPAYLAVIEHTEMPERFEYTYLAGHSCIKWNPDRAIAFFEEADKLKNDYIPLHLHAGALYAAAQKWSDARRHYESARALAATMKAGKHAPLPHALLGLGRVALGEQKIPEAIATLEKARALDTDNNEILAALAIAYTRGGRKKDAERVSAEVGDMEDPRGFVDPISTSMHKEGVSYLSLEQFGVAALRSQEFELALSAFERAFALRPDHPDPALNYAHALMGLARYSEAEPLLDRVLALRPESATAFTFKAACAMARNDLQTAVSNFRRAIAINPRSTNARWNLGRSLKTLNQPAEAKVHFRYILDMKPHRADVRLELAAILADEGKTAEALNEVQQVLTVEPSNARAQALQARLSPR